MNRRSFLATTVKFFSAAIAFLFSLPVFRFIAAAFSTAKSQAFYPIAKIQDVQEEITRIGYTRLLRDGWMTRSVEGYVWIRKKPDGSLVAYEPHCTHLGCAYSWEEKNAQFHCPCHGGVFDKDGKRVEGPPPRPLDRYEVKIEGNQIKIGKVVKA
jgi:menaquinol-cytochrome c reductase iron-sulfur subunit